MYDDFALVYDELMDDFDYPRWARFYIRLLKKAGCAPKTVFECGCGTGSLSVQFARTGWKLTASDLSEDMLRVAQDKARKCGLFIPFVQMDMRALELPRPVDAILACCDAVNYLTSPDDVRTFFDGAFRHLKKGGVLAFDLSSEAKLLPMKNAFYGEERDNVTYLWQNSLDESSRVLTMDLTFFVKEDSGLYRRFDEQHRQRIHTQSEITSLLAECGFSDICVYGDCVSDAPPASPSPDDKRLHFTAKKL